jgi:hypothetical protein
LNNQEKKEERKKEKKKKNMHPKNDPEARDFGDSGSSKGQLTP